MAKSVKCPKWGCDGIGIPVSTKKKFSFGKAIAGDLIGGALFGPVGGVIAGAASCGDGIFTTSNREEEFLEILCFEHFSRFWRFDSITKKGRKKEVIDSVDVSVVLHIV